MKTFINTPALLHSQEEAQRFLFYLYPPSKPDKMLALFNLLRKHESNNISTKELKEIEKKIYGNSKRNRISILYSRLQNEIMNFFLSDSFLKDHPKLETLHAKQVEVKKKFILHYILKYTGRRGQLSNDLLDEAIEEAKKYGYYSDLIKMLHSKRLDRAARYGEEELDKGIVSIKLYEEKQYAVKRSYELYYHLIAYKLFHANPDINWLQKFLVKSMKELQNLYKKTFIVEVLYFLKHLEIDFFQNEKNYKEAKKICEELPALITNNPSIYTRQRIDTAFSQIVQCNIYLKEYNDAMNIFKDKFQFISSYGHDWYEIYEMKLRILFYQKKYSEAFKLLDEMLENLPSGTEPIRPAKLNFYKTCLLFMEGNSVKAQGILSEKSHLNTDKSGWAVSIRMLQLMVYIQAHEKDNFIRSSILLQRFLREYKKDRIASKRDLLMAELFSRLAKENCNIKKVKKEIGKAIKQLSSTKGDYLWDPLSHELIRYDIWLKRVMKKI